MYICYLLHQLRYQYQRTAFGWNNQGYSHLGNDQSYSCPYTEKRRHVIPGDIIIISISVRLKILMWQRAMKAKM